MPNARRNSTDAADAGAPARLVLVLDDEPAVCQAVSAVLSRAGFEVDCCSDPLSFVEASIKKAPACILLDVVLPEVSGLDILGELCSKGCRAPVLMISGESNVATAVQALKNGATDFIEKPFRGSELVSRVTAALDAPRHKATRAIFHFPSRPPLTLREQDVLAELIGGQSTKEIATRLCLSPRTVESYRANIIRKVGARNPADLVRLAIIALRR